MAWYLDKHKENIPFTLLVMKEVTIRVFVSIGLYKRLSFTLHFIHLFLSRFSICE
jgi:hypothetical protein